ncbi:MAG: hypothetical protein WBF43_04015 [Methylocella sp.]
MIEALTIAAAAAIRLLESIAALSFVPVPGHVFPAGARAHRPPDHGPGAVREWLARPGRRIKPLISEAIPARDRGGLPNDHPDRAAMGPNPQKRHARQMPCHKPAIRKRHARFLARRGPQDPEKLARFGHRQLPRRQPQGFPDGAATGYS